MKKTRSSNDRGGTVGRGSRIRDLEELSANPRDVSSNCPAQTLWYPKPGRLVLV